MTDMRVDILEFIKSCVKRHKIHWTYHVNMRLKERFIEREAILSSVDTYAIIEEYPEDRYLPSYLVFAEYKAQTIHIQIATDLENDNIRIVTVYKPTLERWEKDFKRRRRS